MSTDTMRNHVIRCDKQNYKNSRQLFSNPCDFFLFRASQNSCDSVHSLTLYLTPNSVVVPAFARVFVQQSCTRQ